MSIRRGDSDKTSIEEDTTHTLDSVDSEHVANVAKADSEAQVPSTHLETTSPLTSDHELMLQTFGNPVMTGNDVVVETIHLFPP